MPLRVGFSRFAGSFIAGRWSRLALRCQANYNHFVNTVFNYPTLAECYKVAALDAMNKLEGRG
jgi:hypothetical protein